MSVYALLELFHSYRRLFVGTILVFCVGGFLFFHFQRERYETEVLLSVTRTAVTEIADYAYDEFYRLQADERMADTLVAYLTSQSGKRAVAEQALLTGSVYEKYIDQTLRAGRQGANLVVVQYLTGDRAEAERIGEALALVANAKLLELNEDARDQTWFTVIGGTPMIERFLFGPMRVTALSLGGGVFIGFWGVLLVHFWRGYREYQVKYQTANIKQQK